MIWDLISGLLPNVWGYIAAAVTALLGILGVYVKGRRDAKAKADAPTWLAHKWQRQQPLRVTL